MYGIIYTIHAPLCSIHFLISLIDKRRFFSSVLQSDFFIYFCLQYQLVIETLYAVSYTHLTLPTNSLV